MIFTDNKKLKTAQKRSRLCQSRLSYSVPVVISKDRRQQNSMGNTYQYKICQPLLTCFFLHMFSLKYFNSKQRTSFLTGDAASVKSRINPENDFLKKCQIISLIQNHKTWPPWTTGHARTVCASQAPSTACASEERKERKIRRVIQ